MRRLPIVICMACAMNEGMSFVMHYMRMPHTTLASTAANDPEALMTRDAANNSALTEESIPEKVRKRRPRGYYTQEDNMRAELRKFWDARGVSSETVPSYQLLRFYGEGGLAWGIRQWAGPAELAAAFKVPFIPSKWSLALGTDEVQFMIAKGLLSPESIAVGRYGGSAGLLRTGASANRRSQQQLEVARRARQRVVIKGDTTAGIANHGFRPRNYWSNPDNLRRELYTFLSKNRPAVGQPTVWMPRKALFEQAGRSDLSQALSRQGGPDAIAERYGLVPYSQWHYFEKQLTVFKDLQSYIDEYGTPGYMPPLKEIEEKGWIKLKDGIAAFGGSKALAMRLGLARPQGLSVAHMDATKQSGISWQKPTRSQLSVDVVKPKRWQRRKRLPTGELVIAEPKTPVLLGLGPFDLVFALDVLEYVKASHYKRSPGEVSAAVKRGDADSDWDSKISMPFRYDLLADGQIELVLEIEKYGGFEEVARRLQLEYQDKDLKELKRLRTSAAIQLSAANAKQRAIDFFNKQQAQ
jgi:hypothetical protein